MFVYGHASWCRFSLRCVLEATGTSPEDSNRWKVLSTEWDNLEEYRILFWTGNLDEPAMVLHDVKKIGAMVPFHFHRYS